MAQQRDILDLDALREEVQQQQKEHYDWTFANGRRYASSQLGHYYMPNDEPEIQRLNQQHWIFTEVKGGSICNAPVVASKDMRILDLGCGTGIWCLQMAEDFLDAKITGADVSPIQPKNKPDRVDWIVLDIEADWPFSEGSFDLIHLSLVHGCVADWPKTLAKIVRYLKPGGYLEHQEFAFADGYALEKDGTRRPYRDWDRLSSFSKWPELMCEAQEKRGRSMHLGPHLKPWQEAAGLVNVTDTVYAVPLGTWPEDPKQRAIGAQYLDNIFSGFEGFTMTLFTKVLGWTTERTTEFVEACKVDMRDNNIRKMIDVHVVYGQKPIQG